MQKRGLIYGGAFRFFLVIFIAFIIIIFGFNSINKIRKSACTTELISFETNLKGSVEEMYRKMDSVREKNFMVPCDVDKIYFVDLDKEINKSFKSFDEFPFIEDAIRSEVKKNVFIIKNKKLLDSLYVGNIDLREPYFVCSDTSKDNLDLYLAGKGTSAEIVNKDCSCDCTFEVFYINETIAREIIENAIEEGFLDGNISIEMEIFNLTNQSVKIARRYNCGRKPGTTVVEILIKPDGTLKHFRLIEQIPKECIDDLDAYLSNMTGDYDYYKILSDPLIVWHFSDISEETVITYVLDTEMTEYCQEAFDSIGLAVTSESEDMPEDDLDDPVDSPLDINLPDKVEMSAGETDDNIFNKGVWEYAQDADIIDDEIFKDYTYTMSGGSAGTVQCEIIGPEKYVSCSVDTTFSGTETFSVEVDSGTETAHDSFDVEVLTCIDGLTRPCPNQKGVCAGSVEVCTGNNWPGCNDATYLALSPSYYEPEETKCDGFDNDCDGQTDSKQCGSGDCAGTQICDGPVWESCSSSGAFCDGGCGICNSNGDCEKDKDNDGYTELCDGDCNDMDPDINPGATEICNNNLNDDCDASTDCDDSDCSTAPICICELTNAYWSPASASDGQSVNLIVKGSENCDGRTVSFEIEEDSNCGGLGCSITQPNPSTALFSEGTAKITWTAEWQCDGAVFIFCFAIPPETPDPEYIFTATVPGAGEISSGILIVTPCTDVDGDGYGDGNGNYGTANGCTYDEPDCNDNDDEINPGHPELCDGKDNNCESGTDDDGIDEDWFFTLCDGADSDECEEGWGYCLNGEHICTDETSNDLEVCYGGDDEDCDELTDCADTDSCPAGSYAGLCAECNSAGGVRAKADDSSCEAIDCDVLNYYVITPANSPTGTSYCKYIDFEDITSNRCKGIGECKNLFVDCPSSYSETTTKTAGICEYIDGCTGTTAGIKRDYAKGWDCGSKCGAGKVCVCDGSGNCVEAVASLSASHGTLNYQTLPDHGFNPNFHHWWNYATTLKEVGGVVGIYVKERQKCILDNNHNTVTCDSKKDLSPYGASPVYIPPGEQVSRSDDWAYSEKICLNCKYIRETFWDDKGNAVAYYEFSTAER